MYSFPCFCCRMAINVGKVVFNIVIAIVMVGTGTINTLAGKWVHWTLVQHLRPTMREKELKVAEVFSLSACHLSSGSLLWASDWYLEGPGHGFQLDLRFFYGLRLHVHHYVTKQETGTMQTPFSSMQPSLTFQCMLHAGGVNLHGGRSSDYWD